MNDKIPRLPRGWQWISKGKPGERPYTYAKSDDGDVVDIKCGLVIMHNLAGNVTDADLSVVEAVIKRYRLEELQ